MSTTRCDEEEVMTKLAAIVLLSAWMIPSVAGAQSLAELAAAEKERRRKLREEETTQVQTYDEYDLSRTRLRYHTNPAEEAANAPDEEAVAGLKARQNESNAKPPMVLASLVDEAMPEVTRDVEFQRSRGGALPMQIGTQELGTTDLGFLSRRKTADSDTMFDGTLYADWFRVVTNDGFTTGQLSNRVKLEAGKRPGLGWRVFVDGRHRYRATSASPNRLLLYDARVIYDQAENPVTASFGQMNLYETAGVGQLAGGVLGVRVTPSWTIGGYTGLEPDIYAARYDLDYTKHGVFTQYRGSGARAASFSYNRVLFDGITEREFLYGSGLVPISDAAVVYGSAEYELGDGLLAEDRLSHLFLNTRLSVSRSADVTAHYSSGRGLDFHGFLIEQSKDPDRNSAELDRFYYTESYGVRLSLKPHRRVRLFVAQRESEQKDLSIQNHTTQIGASAWNIFQSGFGLYGSYNINRGDASENDSYRVSISRDFGPVSWAAYYSSTFNAIRFDQSTGRPEIVRLTDRNTLSNDFLFDLTDAFSFSVEHDHSARGTDDENALFFRVMFRF
jgi:hypothetical protein